MAVGDILEVRFAERSQDNQNAFQVRHYRVASITGTEPSNAQYAAALSPLFASAWKPTASNRWVYWGCKCRRRLPNPTADSISYVGSGAGTLTAAIGLPPQLCGLISLRASTAPPKTRGRAYFPPGESSSLTTPPIQWSTAQVNLYNVVGAFLIAQQVITPIGGVSSTIVPVVFSPKHLAGYDTTQAITVVPVATQRRRSNTTRTDAVPF